jgi:hypothetical protein
LVVTTKPMPKAKAERLIVREIDSETLVYDRGRDAACCLNEFAASIWRECDGETSVAEIASALGEDERAVWLALHQLTKAQSADGSHHVSACLLLHRDGAGLGFGELESTELAASDSISSASRSTACASRSWSRRLGLRRINP